MSIPESVETFIDQSPISLVARTTGPMSLTEIKTFYEKDISPKVKNKRFGRICLGALMFAQDYIWEGHEIVQDYPDLEASWWHAYMHRMEGDYGNSAYWYRRVGTPSEYTSFFDEVKELELDSVVSQIQDASSWDPYEFNGLISKFENSNTDSLRAVHEREFKFLFSQSYRKAVN